MIWQIQITNCKCDSHISTEVALNLRNLVDGFEANRWFSVDLSKKKENGRRCSFCWRLAEHVDFHGPLTHWSINQNSADENRHCVVQLWQKQSIGKETITWEGGKNTFWPITEARSHNHLTDGHSLVSCKCVGYSKLCTYREGTTKYSKYNLGRVCAKEEYVIIQTCTEWLCARRKTDFCKNTSWTTGDGQQPQHASFRTTSGHGN